MVMASPFKGKRSLATEASDDHHPVSHRRNKMNSMAEGVTVEELHSMTAQEILAERDSAVRLVSSPACSEKAPQWPQGLLSVL